MKRVVIDDKQRPEVTLVVAGQEFRIRRVVNAIRRNYGAVLTKAGDAIQYLADLQRRIDAGEEITDERDRAVEQVEEFVQERDRVVMECVELILEGNGYEFDADWWEKHTDSFDRYGFVAEALNKDVSPGGKKKAAGSTGTG